MYRSKVIALQVSIGTLAFLHSPPQAKIFKVLPPKAARILGLAGVPAKNVPHASVSPKKDVE